MCTPFSERNFYQYFSHKMKKINPVKVFSVLKLFFCLFLSFLWQFYRFGYVRWMFWRIALHSTEGVSTQGSSLMYLLPCHLPISSIVQSHWESFQSLASRLRKVQLGTRSLHLSLLEVVTCHWLSVDSSCHITANCFLCGWPSRVY